MPEALNVIQKTPAQVFSANFVKLFRKPSVAAYERLFFRTDLLVAALVKISECLKYRSTHPQNDVFYISNSIFHSATVARDKNLILASKLLRRC